jgi:hypothetical protein
MTAETERVARLTCATCGKVACEMCGALTPSNEIAAELVFGRVKLLCAGCADVATGRWEPPFLKAIEATEGPAMTEEEFDEIASGAVS